MQGGRHAQADSTNDLATVAEEATDKPVHGSKSISGQGLQGGQDAENFSAMLLCFESQLAKGAGMVQMLTMSALRLLMAL